MVDSKRVSERMTEARLVANFGMVMTYLALTRASVAKERTARQAITFGGTYKTQKVDGCWEKF